MSSTGENELLKYYLQELTYLRRMGADFADEYPSVAGRLALGDHQCTDPHVERLLESFALLTGRIQYNIDQAFPEIPSALLDILYPHLQAPIPSLSIAQFELDATQGAKLLSGFSVEKDTPVFAAAHNSELCWFRTCYPLTLWPLEVTDAELTLAGSTGSLLRLSLRSLPGVTLDKLDLDRLRFYIRGEQTMVSLLYELLFSHAKNIYLAPTGGIPGIRRNGASDDTYRLPDGSLRPVGFGVDEGILPYPRHVHPAYRLLQEYFAFPKKFAFFDITNIDLHKWAPPPQGAPAGQPFDICITFDEAEIQLHRREIERIVSLIDDQTFCLGCTPIINLFAQKTDPIRLDYRQSEYMLIPDARRQRTTEVYSVERVTAVSEQGTETKQLSPLFGLDQLAIQRNQKAFWHARRRAYRQATEPGSEMMLTFMDLTFNPTVPDVQTVYADTLCTNRDLAQRLPPGTELQIQQAVPARRITCLDKPTPETQPTATSTDLWKLVSQLTLNHLSLSDIDQFTIGKKYRADLINRRLSPELRAIFQSNGARLSPHVLVVPQDEVDSLTAGIWTIQDEDTGRVFTVVQEANQLAVSSDQESLRALRGILRLYSLPEDITAQRQLQGICEMVCRRVVKRICADRWGGFARGIEITLTFDEDYYQGQSVFLLASVLNYFFPLYVSANMFTQLVARKQQDKGDAKRWEPMAGGQPVL